ncbi:MAG TPA: lycopene cyclase domain-containing protein [Flavobacteriales bacterium]|nr:lycopene cyclase domain-containing protein [Flavobacteriales bacterium]
MWTYLWVDLGAFIIPFLFSFHPRLRFHREWGRAWPAILGMMLLFIPWDILATARGVWGFNDEHLIGVQLLGLPVEEWLFFFCIPYACLFTYHCFQVLNVPGLSGRAARAVTWVLLLLSVGMAWTFRERMYTGPTFVLCALFFVLLLLRPQLLPAGRAYFTYGVLLLPFFITNGILTGTGLERPVVWYNAAHIMGPRLGSVPVEDVFYGLLMFLLTVWLFEAAPWRKRGMPLTLGLGVLITLSSFSGPADRADLELLRHNYPLAAHDRGRCRAMIDRLEELPPNPITSGYLGAYEALWAQHALNPITKLSSFRRGTQRIDKAIAIDRDNVELRFLRLSIQRNCPAFLGYDRQQAEDEQILRQQSGSVHSPQLQGMIAELLAKE